jgi:hypothetical protein
MADNLALYSPVPEPIPLAHLRRLVGHGNVRASRDPAGRVSAYRIDWGDVRVTLNVMPEEQLADHLQGFQGYVLDLAGEEAEDHALAPILDRIAATKLVHGVVVEPGFDREGKVNRLVLDLLEHYGALLFADGSVYDEEANLLIGPAEEGEEEGEGGAEGEEDAGEGEEEEWEPTPNQLERAERSKSLLRQRRVPYYKGPLFVDDDRQVRLRPPAEVARRALVLWAVARRGEGVPREEARALLDRLNLWDAVSAEERAFLEDPEPDAEVSGRFVWRLESLWVLLWALGHVEELGWPEGFCDVPRLVKLLRRRESDPDFVAKARLRSAGEILDAQDLTLRIHWAVRDAWLNKRPVPKDLDWSSSAERVRAEECPAVGVVEQRHHTLNWLVSFGGDDWDHVDTPT